MGSLLVVLAVSGTSNGTLEAPVPAKLRFHVLQAAMVVGLATRPLGFARVRQVTMAQRVKESTFGNAMEKQMACGSQAIVRENAMRLEAGVGVQARWVTDRWLRHAKSSICR
mmetsp:Transcript_14716/g.36761  ORF Transcript_14716/g.36761 Transcript_14716/m.36761 type:complete len:112 (-) Transcript_14716:81-416(-)